MKNILSLLLVVSHASLFSSETSTQQHESQLVHFLTPSQIQNPQAVMHDALKRSIALLNAKDSHFQNGIRAIARLLAIVDLQARIGLEGFQQTRSGSRKALLATIKIIFNNNSRLTVPHKDRLKYVRLALDAGIADRLIKQSLPSTFLGISERSTLRQARELRNFNFIPSTTGQFDTATPTGLTQALEHLHFGAGSGKETDRLRGLTLATLATEFVPTCARAWHTLALHTVGYWKPQLIFPDEQEGMNQLRIAYEQSPNDPHISSILAFYTHPIMEMESFCRMFVNLTPEQQRIVQRWKVNQYYNDSL